MKIFSSVLCIFMAILVFSGCSQSIVKDPYNSDSGNRDVIHENKDDSTDSSKQTDDNSNIKVSYFHADWPQYDTIDMLVDASSNVFEGKLTNIYFDVVDLYTGESANKDSKASKLHIYTIYEVEVNTSYKGVNTDKVYIKVIGGMEGYMESMQYEKLNEHGIYDENVGILVLDCFEPLTIGKTYLFLTDGQVGPYHNIVNNTQFAYDSMEPSTAKGFSFTEVKSYVTSVPNVDKS